MCLRRSGIRRRMGPTSRLPDLLRRSRAWIIALLGLVGRMARTRRIGRGLLRPRGIIELFDSTALWLLFTLYIALYKVDCIENTGTGSEISEVHRILFTPHILLYHLSYLLRTGVHYFILYSFYSFYSPLNIRQNVRNNSRRLPLPVDQVPNPLFPLFLLPNQRHRVRSRPICYQLHSRRDFNHGSQESHRK